MKHLFLLIICLLAIGVAPAKNTKPPVNISPTAKFMYKINNYKVDFFGSYSTDPDGKIINYSWDFGQPSSADNTYTSTSSSSASHDYSRPGKYPVKLVVTDDKGAIGTASLTVTLLPENTKPLADFTYTITGNKVDFDGASSTDSDGKVTKYDWNFGEPSSGNSNTESSKTSSISHTYAGPGSYEVTLTVTDNQGGSATKPQTVIILPPPNNKPIADFSYEIDGYQVRFYGSLSIDTDGEITNYQWNFDEPSSGDGNTASSDDSSASHTYAGPGTYGVTLVITDDGGATDTKSYTVTILPRPNIAPKADFAYWIIGYLGEFDGSSSINPPNGYITNYQWDFGEPSSGGKNTASSGSSFVTHNYAGPGRYEVTLTVTDNRGATATKTYTVEILPVAKFESQIYGNDVRFTAVASPKIVSYAWTFGDPESGDSDKATITTTNIAYHRYTRIDSYTVFLTVTDEAGKTATMKKVIQLTNPNYGCGYGPLHITMPDYFRYSNFTYMCGGLVVRTPDGVVQTGSSGDINFAFLQKSDGLSANICWPSNTTPQSGTYDLCCVGEYGKSPSNPAFVTAVVYIPEKQPVVLTRAQTADSSNYYTCDSSSASYVGSFTY